MKTFMRILTDFNFICIVVNLTIFLFLLTFVKKGCTILVSMRNILANIYGLMSGYEPSDIIQESAELETEEEQDANVQSADDGEWE